MSEHPYVYTRAISDRFRLVAHVRVKRVYMFTFTERCVLQSFDVDILGGKENVFEEWTSFEASGF